MRMCRSSQCRCLHLRCRILPIIGFGVIITTITTTSTKSRGLCGSVAVHLTSLLSHVGTRCTCRRSSCSATTTQLELKRGSDRPTHPRLASDGHHLGSAILLRCFAHGSDGCFKSLLLKRSRQRVKPLSEEGPAQPAVERTRLVKQMHDLQLQQVAGKLT